MLPLAVVLCHLFIHVQSKNLSFIFVTSFGQHGINSSGVVPAVEMALDDINNNSDILPGYNLAYENVKDSQCRYSRSLEAFYSEIQSNPVKIAVIGCGCSVATQPVAAIASYWNIPHISYLSVSPALSDRDVYKNFFRLHASDTVHYPAFYSMMNHFGWKRIAILTQNEDIFTLAELKIRELLGKAKYTVQSRVFQTNSDPVTTVDDFFHEDDYRIFFLNCYSGPARKIMCMAAKRKYTYPRYAWILNDWYTSKWWTAAEDNGIVNCTDNELQSFLDKVIFVHSLPAASDYTGPTGLGAPIGPIQFDINGTRMLDTVLLKQFKTDSSGSFARVSFAYFSVQDNYTWRFLPNHSDDIVFPGGIPPDGTPKKIIAILSIPTVVTLDALATCGLIFTLICFLFNHGFRRKRVIRLSSTNLNNAIIIGAVFMYSSVYANLVPTDVASIAKSMCALKEWLFIVGYSLCFETVLAKMGRIYTVFQNPTAQKKNAFIKDWHLMLVIAAIVGIGIVLLLIETTISYTTESITMNIDNENPTGVTASDGVRVERYVLVCHKTSSRSFYWRIVIIVYLVVIQLVGIILAFQTRKVKFPGLNDSKFVGTIIYISSIILVILTMDTFLLNNYLNIYGVSHTFGILILTTIFLSLTFIPKMVILYKKS